MTITLGIGALPLTEIAALCGGTLTGTNGTHVPHRLVTSSREIGEGDLFCALHGKRDGHLFISEAAERGACAVIAERVCHEAFPHILVPSTKGALGSWAGALAKRAGFLRIGITGSVGKTTLKDALAAVLEEHARVHATEGNHNNELGLPLTLLSAPRDTEICICEMGISERGEMRRLSRILAPHISLVSCIGHAHIGAFGTREEIAKEKRDILLYAEENGLLLVPSREPLLSFLPPRGIRRIAVSPLKEEDCRSHALPLLQDDAPLATALAFCIATAKALGLSEEKIDASLTRALARQKRRKEEQVFSLLFIEDGYNASPESVMASLRFLSARAKGRRVAVLGDMLELGERTAAFHRAMGRFAARHAELLLFFGAYAEHYAKGARAEGAGEGSVFCLSGEKDDLAVAIAAHLKENDTVLFKASHALGADALAEAVKRILNKSEE